MTDAAAAADEAAIGERRHLVALAFRMLGSTAEAEDVAQDAYARWFRMPPDERASITSPRAWLTRVAGRICLDVLGSARARRERYTGPWLPEPIPALTLDAPVGDPVERAALDESVGSALLVVLESMTPAERVVFVLHEVFAVPFAEVAETVGRSDAACRQLAASARRRVDRDRARRVPRAEHDAVVRAFAVAAGGGDLAGVIALLDPSVQLRSDGGGVVSAARNPVSGADRVARFVLGVVEKNPALTIEERPLPGGLGFALLDGDRVTGVVELDVGVAGVEAVRIVLAPAKLARWNLR